MKGRAIIAPHEEPRRGTNVVDLMSALKKSLRNSNGGGAEAPARAKKVPAKAAAKATQNQGYLS